MNKIEGLIAAAFTPMSPDGSLNLDIIPEYYNMLEKNKVAGVFVCGTNGEGVALTQKERTQVVEAWAKQYNKKKTVKIISVVGGTSYQECKENAIASSEQGVSGISIVTPYYFKPTEMNQLVEFCAKVGDAVPKMPVYYYHIPMFTGSQFLMLDFLKAAAPAMPNLAGIKYSHADIGDYQNCMNFDGGKFDMLWGRDETILSVLVLGARGAIGSTYNYIAPLYHALINAFDKGDLITARKLQLQAMDTVLLMGKYGGIASGKSYMRYLGIDCGEFRSPIKNMDDAMYKQFCSDVKALKMDELFSKC